MIFNEFFAEEKNDQNSNRRMAKDMIRPFIKDETKMLTSTRGKMFIVSNKSNKSLEQFEVPFFLFKLLRMPSGSIT